MDLGEIYVDNYSSSRVFIDFSLLHVISQPDYHFRRKVKAPRHSASTPLLIVG